MPNASARAGTISPCGSGRPCVRLHQLVAVSLDPAVDGVRAARGQRAADDDRGDQPERGHALLREQHGRDRGDQEQLDDPGLREPDVRADRRDQRPGWDFEGERWGGASGDDESTGRGPGSSDHDRADHARGGVAVVRALERVGLPASSVTVPVASGWLGVTFSSNLGTEIVNVCSWPPFSCRVTVSGPGDALMVLTSKWYGSDAFTSIVPPAAVFVTPAVLPPPPPHAPINTPNPRGQGKRHASLPAAGHCEPPRSARLGKTAAGYLRALAGPGIEQAVGAPAPTLAASLRAMPDGRESKHSIRMVADRLLVVESKEAGERKSRAGILIPATADVSRRLVWAEVAAVGPTVRTVEAGDTVLFSPDTGLRGRDPGRGVPHPARARRPRRCVAPDRGRHGALPVIDPATALRIDGEGRARHRRDARASGVRSPRRARPRAPTCASSARKPAELEEAEAAISALGARVVTVAGLRRRRGHRRAGGASHDRRARALRRRRQQRGDQSGLRSTHGRRSGRRSPRSSTPTSPRRCGSRVPRGTSTCTSTVASC